MEENHPSAIRGLWLVVILMAGVIAAVLAVAAFWLVKADSTAVFAAGGATFLGVSSLGMAMRRFLTDSAD